MDNPQKDALENKSWDGTDRRSGEEHRRRDWNGSNMGEHSHHDHHRHRSHRRWRKFKKLVQTSLFVMGVCFLASLLFTYITGSLPNIIQGIIQKNVEKTIQRATGGLVDGQLSPDKLLKLGKNIKPEDFKGNAMRQLGGWGGGERGGEQIPEEHASISKEQFDQLKKYKDQYKEQYKAMIGK